MCRQPIPAPGGVHLLPCGSSVMLHWSHVQMARQLGALLAQHMQQWTYSALGALRWIQDLGRYRDTLYSLAGASAALVRPHPHAIVQALPEARPVLRLCMSCTEVPLQLPLGQSCGGHD